MAIPNPAYKPKVPNDMVFRQGRDQSKVVTLPNTVPAPAKPVGYGAAAGGAAGYASPAVPDPNKQPAGKPAVPAGGPGIAGVPDPLTKFGGKDHYAKSQNTRWQDAGRNNDTDLMGRLIADSKRFGYALDPHQAPEPVQAEPDPAAAEYQDWKAKQDESFKSFQAMASAPFTYDPNTDPGYLAQRQLAQQRAGGASQAAMEQLNERGILNSSVTAAQLAQIQQDAEQQALSYIPQYRAEARGDHQERLRNAASMLEYTTGRGDTAYNRNYQAGRDERNDTVTDRAFDRGVKESDRAFDRGVKESDRQFDHQAGRDKVADSQWLKSFDENKRQFGEEFAHQKARDAILDKQTQQKFDEDVRQFGLDYAMRETAQMLAQDDNARAWADLDHRITQDGVPKYDGMTPDQLLGNIRENYSEPITQIDPITKKVNKIGDRMTMDPNKRYQMFLDVVDSNLPDQTQEDQVLISLGFNKDEIAEMEDRAQKEYGVSPKADSVSVPQAYAGIVNNAAKKYGEDPNLVAAIIKQESGYDPKTKSSAGAQGLMQLMPGTAKGLGVKDPYDPVQNVDAGVRYLGQMKKTFGGDVELALAAYNWGIGNVQKAVKQHGGSWAAIRRYAPHETQGYVSKVMTTYRG